MNKLAFSLFQLSGRKKVKQNNQEEPEIPMISSHAASSTDEHTKQFNILPSEEQHQPRTDVRITNKGSLERRSYTNTEKFMLADEVSGAIQNGCKNAQE